MKNVILDLDTGIDDTLALLYVLSKRDEINLLGITSVFGNVETRVSARNSLTILDLFDRKDVPVYLGQAAPYGKESYKVKEEVQLIHGKNGLGNVSFPTSNREIKDDGIKFIRDMILAHPGDITIVPTGPLTNIAALYERFPEVLKVEHEIISMGGALTVEGNVTEVAEANYYKDPIGAGIVFSKNISLKMICLDVTQQSHLYPSDINKWNGYKGNLIKSMVEFYINFHKVGYCYLHDPSAVCAILHPEYFTFLNIPLYVTSQGRVIGKYNSNLPLKQSAIAVDHISVEKELKASWQKLFE